MTKPSAQHQIKTQNFLPYGQQWIDEEDIKAVEIALKMPYLTCGPLIDRFEESLAEKCEVKYAVAVSNGTAALHLSTLALGIKPGDKVIVPTITFLATANAVRYLGGDIIFADVDPKTGLMTYDSFLKAYAEDPSNIKAIYYVHLAGQVGDFEKIAIEAKKKGILILEDAAHAIGTKYKNTQNKTISVGSCCYSDLTIFSFHPVKTITTGEGGAITTNNFQFYERLKMMRHHGMVRDPSKFLSKELGFTKENIPNPWSYEMPELGFNYRLTDIQCALGLSQLKKLDFFIEKRQEIVQTYDQSFKNFIPFIQLLDKKQYDLVSWHLYILLIDFEALKTNRAEFMNQLKEKGIGTQVHYIPIHLQPYYQNLYGAKELEGAKNYYQKALSLPLFPLMKKNDVSYVIDTIKNFLS